MILFLSCLMKFQKLETIHTKHVLGIELSLMFNKYVCMSSILSMYSTFLGLYVWVKHISGQILSATGSSLRTHAFLFVHTFSRKSFFIAMLYISSEPGADLMNNNI